MLATFKIKDDYAVCYIFEGKNYQNLCPEGRCLQKLPFKLPFLLHDGNTSAQESKGLVRYSPHEAAEYPDVFSAISHYRTEVIILCLLSALIFHLAFICLRKRSFRKGVNFLTRGWLFKNHRDAARTYSPSGSRHRLNAGPTFDDSGAINIGKVSFDLESVIGYGSKGTCVFRGNFEYTTPCAVKRIVSQYLSIADREVDFLRSLNHPNLVRYLATEEDAQFVYIALELAEYTLSSIVETNRISEIGLSKIDLCLQSAEGLRYLHRSNIVHRDIKPQNILISYPVKPDQKRKVMISDFGLSKQLSNSDLGHTSSAMRYFDGTQGWMAPEIVNAKIKEDKTLKPTKSADIFSLGCVFYYILSDGKHPFGQTPLRQANILKNDTVLNEVSMKNEESLNVAKEIAIMSTKLILTMIRPEPDERPSITTVLKYPLFWSKSKQLQFLQDVSDRIDKEDKDNQIVWRLEKDRRSIFGFGWKDCLGDEVRENLTEFRKYNDRSVRHLLRAIRNKRHHYRELPEKVQACLGEVPDDFMDYFASRFPELLPHVYRAMQACKDECIFEAYYERKENFAFE